MGPTLKIIDAGMMATFQDSGRPGYQRYGIPVSGALDRVSLHAANLLVGNPPDETAIEIAYLGPTLETEAESVRVAFAGADADITITGSIGDDRHHVLPALRSIRLERGQRLRIGALKGSAVGYLAVEGGFAIDRVLGSTSTLTRARIGGFRGRRLEIGDCLPIKQETCPKRIELMLPRLHERFAGVIRVMMGPQSDYFSDRGISAFLSETYRVSKESDRMGMRLEGPPVHHSKDFNIVSDGIAPGAIQVPGNGLPIILLADRQTTGGYPKIATVISADLDALARLSPGTEIKFTSVPIEEAEAARQDLLARVESLRKQLLPIPEGSESLDEAALRAANLVSGVIDALE